VNEGLRGNNRDVFAMRLQLIAGCVLSFCLFTGSQANQIEPTSTSHHVIAKKPFSAIIVEYVKGITRIKAKTRIYYSQNGMRTERLDEQSEEPKFVVIKNFNTKQMWLVNPAKQVFAEITRDETNKEKQAAEADKRQAPGVLSNEPCIGMSSEKQTVRVVGDTELSVWRCVDSDNKQYLQHFSTLLGVVIRQESQDGQVSELKDIAFIDDSTKYFEPTSKMQQLSLEELLTGNLKLPAFIE
jgi:hypothetical protein